MDIYLLRSGHSQLALANDPYTPPLTERGVEQARRLATCCREWGIEFLCSSEMIRAQQTADIILEALPDAYRWDLSEMEGLNPDDLLGEPTTPPLVSRWNARQRALGVERMWVRVTAALARITVFCQTQGYERVAIVAHADVVNLLLLNWMGLDWRALDQFAYGIDPGSSSLVVLEGGAPTTIAWVNRAP